MYRAKQQDNVPEWEQEGVVYKELIEIGGQVGVLRYRYNRDARPIAQWFYAPASRKVKPQAYAPERSTLGETMILADVVGEEIPRQTWRLVTATVALVPGLVKNQHARFGGSGGGYPLDPWELRYVYVLEMVPRSSSSPYSRKVFYVGQQTFAPFYAIIFNRDNTHWRTIFFRYGNPQFSQENRDVRAPIFLGQSSIDHQTSNVAVQLVNKALYDQPLPLTLFTFSGLTKRGK